MHERVIDFEGIATWSVSSGPTDAPAIVLITGPNPNNFTFRGNVDAVVGMHLAVRS